MYTAALTPLMPKEPITTRLDPDIKSEVENYAEDRDIGQTEAARRLIRAGLTAEGHPIAATDGGVVTATEFDAFRQEQRRANRNRTAALSVGLIYVAVELVANPSGLWWPLLGVAVVVAALIAAVAPFAQEGSE